MTFCTFCSYAHSKIQLINLTCNLKSDKRKVLSFVFGSIGIALFSLITCLRAESLLLFQSEHSAFFLLQPEELLEIFKKNMQSIGYGKNIQKKKRSNSYLHSNITFEGNVPN